LAKRARAMLLVADGHRFAATARQVELRERHVRKGALRFVAHGIAGLYDKKRPGREPVFSPPVAMYGVTLACERPALVGRSLSQWDSTELARPWERDGGVESILPPTVQRLLAHRTLKPWRHPLGLASKVPRDAVCAMQGQARVTRYPRPRAPHERGGVWRRKPVCHRGPARPQPERLNLAGPSTLHRHPAVVGR
jgi:hypothetical protein